MVRNRIKVLLAEAEITATTLVEKMPAGVDKVAMSYITNGRVLPTRESLETMCDVFSCTPADIYEPREIDLLSVRRQAAQAVQSDGCPKTAETDEKQDDGIEDALDEDFLDGELGKIEETFNVTLDFPIELKDEVTGYIREHGKDELVELMIEAARKEE